MIKSCESCAAEVTGRARFCVICKRKRHSQSVIASRKNVKAGIRPPRATTPTSAALDVVRQVALQRLVANPCPCGETDPRLLTFVRDGHLQPVQPGRADETCDVRCIVCVAFTDRRLLWRDAQLTAAQLKRRVEHVARLAQGTTALSETERVSV